MRRRSFRDSFAVSSDFNALRGGKFPRRVYSRADEEHECDRRTMLLSVMAGLVPGLVPAIHVVRLPGPFTPEMAHLAGVPISILHRAKSKLWAPFSATARACHSRGSPIRVARRQPRARVPHLVGSTLARPYHFRARIESFQVVAAPFPGNSVLPSGPLAARSRRGKRLDLARSRGAPARRGFGAASRPLGIGPARSRDSGRVRSST